MGYLKSHLPPIFFDELKAVYDEKINAPFCAQFDEDLQLKIAHAVRFGAIIPPYWYWHDQFIKNTDEQKKALQVWFNDQIQHTKLVNLYESSYIYTIQCAYLDGLKAGKIMVIQEYENHCQRLLDKMFS